MKREEINRNNALYQAYKTGATVHDSKGKAYKVAPLWDASRPRCSYNNTKTGITSVSLLAGDMKSVYNGAMPAVVRDVVGDVSGTCAGNCPGCYAKRVTRNISPSIKYALNTIEAKKNPERFIQLVENELFSGNPLTWPRVVRLHDSGEIFSLRYFRAICAMIERHPGTVFGAYTKSKKIIEKYGLDNLPKNLVLSCSPWEGYCDPIGDLPQFIYDDGTDPDVARLPHCPAVNKDGHRTGVTCSQCLHCYTAKRGDRWAVYAH